MVKRVRDKKTLETFAMKIINVAMLQNVRRIASASFHRPELRPEQRFFD